MCTLVSCVYVGGSCVYVGGSCVCVRAFSYAEYGCNPKRDVTSSPSSSSTYRQVLCTNSRVRKWRDQGVGLPLGRIDALSDPRWAGVSHS